MLDSTITALGLAYLAIGAGFAGLADYTAVRDLPAWYRRERGGWLALFALLWPLCLALLLLCWRLCRDDGPGAKPGKSLRRRIRDPARSHHPATAGPLRWP